jgi:hypothetical protein
LSRWFDFIREKFLFGPMIDTISKNENFLTDGSMLLVAIMTDSIGIEPSPIRRKQRYCIFFNKKLHRIGGLKGMCENKMKRNHTHDFFSFCSDTSPLILVFYAAFY